MIDARGGQGQKGGVGTPTSLEGFLLACREPFQREIPPLLDALFDKLDDALYDLADKAGSDRLYARYYDAMRLFRKQNRNVKAIFLRQLERTSELTASGLVEPDSGFLDSLRAEDFALVEEAELEETLAVGNLVSKAESRYHRQLHELGCFLGALLSRRELPARANPLGPVAVCDAFCAALKPLQDIDLAIKLVAYKLFDKHVMDHLGGVYDQCLALARDRGHGATPATRGTATNRPGPAASLSRETQALRPRSAEAAQRALTEAVGRIPFDELRALLDQWRSPRPQTTDAGETVTVQTSELTAILTQLQDAMRSARNGPIASLEVRSRLDGALNAHHPGQVAGRRSLGEIDEDTLDLVFLLFESIVQGGDFPDPIKALVGRLQIPLVKLALLDKTFFDDRDHPARRLLNRIADAVVGWAEDEDRTPDSLYGRIERLVERIIAEFDRDLTLFARLDAELAAYLSHEAVRVRAIEANVCSIAAGRDRMASARRKAQAVIDERLTRGPRVPEVVESLLTEGWREVLFAAYLSGGEGSREWLTAVDVVDRLLWSVQPKIASDDRRDLLRGVPDLLRTLRGGLTAVAFDQRLLSRWFKELQALHLTALRGAAGSQDLAVARQTPRETPVAANPGTTAPRTSPGTGAETAGLLRRLVPGSWVELVRDDARRVRVKLAWVSGDGQSLQFVDRQGREGPHMARDDLAILLEYGLANLVRGEDDLPLVDRAIATLARTLNN